jgi:hydroxymethylbilane synthase
MNRIVIGTRASKLALWQANYVAELLRSLYADVEVVIQHITTRGDLMTDQPLPEIGGKGLFTEALEQALKSNEIDLAVHSFKDLPTKIDDALIIAAVPTRANPFDVLVSRNGELLQDLPEGAVVGTSSLRRLAQIKAARPDLDTLSLRGNVPTRVEKLFADGSHYDAIVLACAGLARLGLDTHITEVLEPPIMIPAPAQGALAIQCCGDNAQLIETLAPLNDDATALAVEAEREFLSVLDAGCRLPVAAFSWIDDAQINIIGRVCSLDGQQVITLEESAPIENRANLGNHLAQSAIAQGAGVMLAEVSRLLESDDDA